MLTDAIDEPARIVSLLPSATEIVCALGAAERLVGISHECDFPDTVRGRPVLTRSRIDPGGSSRAIDTAVRAVVGDTLSIYAVDEAQLGALASLGARVYLTDGNAFFNRPGPRIVESLEIMAACVHPNLFADFADKHGAEMQQL